MVNDIPAWPIPLTITDQRALIPSPGSTQLPHQHQLFLGLVFSWEEESWPPLQPEVTGPGSGMATAPGGPYIREQVWVADQAYGQRPGRAASGMQEHVDTEESTLCPWVSAQAVM